MANDIQIASTGLPWVSSTSLFRALGNATRMAMIRQLATGGAMAVNDFVSVTNRNQVAVSRHLTLLFRAGAVIKVAAPDGDQRKQFYAILPERLSTGKIGLEIDYGTCVVRLPGRF